MLALGVFGGPLLMIEDRPDFLRPNGKARQAVGTWFAGRR